MRVECDTLGRRVAGRARVVGLEIHTDYTTTWCEISMGDQIRRNPGTSSNIQDTMTPCVQVNIIMLQMTSVQII